MPTLIAHTIDYPPHRYIGAELATHRTLAYLAEHGWDCIARPAATRADLREPYDLDGVHVTSLPITSLPRPDVVLHHNTSITLAVTHAQMHKVPRVMTLHGGWASWLRDRVRTAAPDLVVANSEAMARPLRDDGQPVTVLHPPCWPPKPGAPPARPGGSVTLVNLSEGKGVEAFYELARRLPAIPFLGVRGGYGDQFDPIGENVTVLPHGVDMEAVWRQTSVLIMPSRDESWGMVAVEAMHRGIPVVGSAIPGLMECIGPLPRVPIYGPLGEDTFDLWQHVLSDVYGNRWLYWHDQAVRRGAELDPSGQLAAFDARLREMIT